MCTMGIQQIERNNHCDGDDADFEDYNDYHTN